MDTKQNLAECQPSPHLGQEQQALFFNKKQQALFFDTYASALADTHCHLSMLDGEKGSGDKQFFTDSCDALCRAARAGLKFIVTVTDPTEDAQDPQAYIDWLEALKDEAQKKEPLCADLEIVLTCGCHPHNAQHFDQKAQEALRYMLKYDKCSALGEVGLDYHYDFSPRAIQQETFRRQIRLAHELGLPLALHLREAHDDAYRILIEEGLPQAGVLLHCFNLGKEELIRFQDLGCFFSIGGPVSFKSCEELREALPFALLDRLMVETDAPYMAPTPLRGIKCEPAMSLISHNIICDILSAHHGLNKEDVSRQLYNNARRFYRSQKERGVDAGLH